MLRSIQMLRPKESAAAGGFNGAAFPSSVKWVMVLGVLGLVLLQSPATAPIGWVMLNFYLFCIFEFLLIIPHELAHAFTAVLLRMRVFRIVLGAGKQVAAFRCCGWDWQINSVLVGGMTRASARTANWYRTRHVLVTLAGPLVSAVPVLWFAVLTLRGDTVDTAFTAGICLGAVLVLASLVSVLTALAPRPIRTATGRSQSDGLALLRLPFISDAEIRSRLAWYYSLCGADYRRQGNPDAALACYEEGLAKTGSHPVLRMDQAVVLIDLRRCDEARSLLRAFLEREDIGTGMKLLAMNNLACADLLSRNEEYLEEADQLSAEVFAALPQVAACRSTRGAVLLARGEIAAGLALLKDSIGRDKPWAKKAVDACWIAVGEARRGNDARAREFALLAETLAPDSRLLAFVREELAVADREDELLGG